MTIGKFTLAGKVNQVGKDSADAGIDQDKTVLTGWVGILTSNYPNDLPLPDGSDIDYLDFRIITLLTDGSITEDGVNAGISLTAHDPAVFDTPLQWTIRPGRVTLTSGRSFKPKPWTFDANLDGVALTLGDATPVAAQEMKSTARGPRGYTTYWSPVGGGQYQQVEDVTTRQLGSPTTLNVSGFPSAIAYSMTFGA